MPCLCVKETEKEKEKTFISSKGIIFYKKIKCVYKKSFWINGKKKKL